MTDKKKNFDIDSVTVIVLALLIGCFLGMVIPSKLIIPARLFFHNIYIKLNPDAEKDTHTLILEKVTQDTQNLPQKSIFEEPKKKENKFVLYIKKVFRKNKTEENSPTIDSYILN